MRTDSQYGKCPHMPNWVGFGVTKPSNILVTARLRRLRFASPTPNSEVNTITSPVHPATPIPQRSTAPTRIRCPYQVLACAAKRPRPASQANPLFVHRPHLACRRHAQPPPAAARRRLCAAPALMSRAAASHSPCAARSWHARRLPSSGSLQAACAASVPHR